MNNAVMGRQNGPLLWDGRAVVNGKIKGEMLAGERGGCSRKAMMSPLCGDESVGNRGCMWWQKGGIRVARTGKKTAHRPCMEDRLVGRWSVCVAR